MCVCGGGEGEERDRKSKIESVCVWGGGGEGERGRERQKEKSKHAGRLYTESTRKKPRRLFHSTSLDGNGRLKLFLWSLFGID